MAKIANISSIVLILDEEGILVKINWTNLTNWKAQQAFEKLMADSNLNYAGSRSQSHDYLVLDKTTCQGDINFITSIFVNQGYSFNRNGNTITFS